MAGTPVAAAPVRWAWNQDLTYRDLVFRRHRLFAYRLVAFVAFCYALGSLALGVVMAVPFLEAGTYQVVLPPALSARPLWLAALLGTYAWYRLLRERSFYPEIPRSAEGEVAVEQYLSEETWAVLESAFRYASKFGHAAVDPLHLLAASLLHPTGRRLVTRLGVAPEKLVSTLRNALLRLPEGKEPRLAAAAVATLTAAAELATARRSYHVETSELMVAVAQSESLVRDVLEELTVPTSAILNISVWFSLRHKLAVEILRRRKRSGYRPKHALDRAYLAIATPFLNSVSHDLTTDAAAGYLYPCVGREDQVRQVFQILEGGHGAVLLGEPGVGKGSMVDGIAQAMAADEVPAVLQDKHLLQLSLPQLLSGASPAEAGTKLMRALTEAVRAGNVVLAIENVHQLAGLKSADQLGLAEVLANVIAKYGLTVVATAERSAWRAFESSALGAALQPVVVEELDDDRAVQVVESRVGGFERASHVFFSYGAIEACVKLSRRYLPDRYLPEKALTLAEEVARSVRDRRGQTQVVGAEDVAQVVAQQVHIPLTQVTDTERDRLVRLEEILKGRIIGQDEAVTLVAQALRRGRVNLRDQKRPVASFLFLGPTGVGKTELAKTVSAEYFGGEDKMVRLDMSEYQTAESLYRLVGAPGGVGHDTGLLTEAVRRNPYTLVLLDELEKAHPDILNVFLQVLDDGRLTDATGRTVDFTNTIIIATSNAGTQFIQDSMASQVPQEFIRRSLLKGGLQDYFRPEFLNRFDGVVVFRPLAEEDVVKIAGLLLAKLGRELEQKGVHLKVTPEAVAELAHKGFDPLYGARPLRRVIQDTVDSALASYLLTGKITRRDVVVLEPGGGIRVEKAEKL